MVNRLISSTVLGLALVPIWAAGLQAQGYNVTTYHYDNLRTGWNSQEKILRFASVSSSSFGLLHSVTLPSTVHTQPLFVSNQAIQGQTGTFGVVYLLVDAGDVLAIDSATGKILLSRGLAEGSSFYKIAQSTPVIDLSTQTMYLIISNRDASGNPHWYLHAISLSTLADTIPPVEISATQVLSDGSTYNFLPLYSKVRVALLEANGNIYAGTTSVSDLNANLTRGWVLGWNAASLKPLANSELTMRQATSPKQYFLGSIWMTSAGIAADPQGNLYFTTGNSDPKGTTYDGVLNIQESAVKLSADLSTVEDIFTPGGTLRGVGALDMVDGDFSAGGILLTPPQPGATPNLAAAAGKAGIMYLLNQNKMGGYTASNLPNGADAVVGAYNIGPCWCAPSYFTDPQGVGHIVSSGGSQLINWKIKTSPAVSLVNVQSAAITTGGDGGFFTSVSSNGTNTSSYLIWAVSRPVSINPGTVTLYAFANRNGDDKNGSPNNGFAFSGTAGYDTNANLDTVAVPVVANGKVFVAVGSSLSIFGLGATNATVPKIGVTVEKEKGNIVFGKIVRISGSTVTLRLRSGKAVMVDAADALEQGQSVLLLSGRALIVHGEYTSTGVIHAKMIERAKDSPALWGADQ